MDGRTDGQTDGVQQLINAAFREGHILKFQWEREGKEAQKDEDGRNI